MLKFISSALMGLVVSGFMFASAIAAGVEINATSTGLALRGFDPVAYFTVGAPTPGDWQITAKHNGATYRFANEENKAKFVANPQAYVPAYGGYCAFGTAMGYKFDGDPKVWKIVDNKLFLNISKGVQTRWESEQAKMITDANANWTKIRDKSPEALAN